MAYLLNITQLASQDIQMLREIFTHSTPTFLARKKVFRHSDKTPFQLSHNLILDTNSTTTEKRYFVISNNPESILGDGGYSKARKVIGIVGVNRTSHKITYTADTSWAVRITNPKKTQKQNQKAHHVYNHKPAVAAYNAHKPFNHLAFQLPVERGPYTGKTGFAFFTKSYTAMKRMPGVDLIDAIDPFVVKHGNIKAVIKGVFIPLLLAYQKQIADKGYVHRDLKLENIRAILHSDGSSIINIMDCDNCVRIDAKESLFGTPGYIAPEVLESVGKIAIKPSIDIFALGITFISCLNSKLAPINYFNHWAEHNPDPSFTPIVKNQNTFSYFLVCRDECYNPDKLLDCNGVSYDLFEQFREGRYSPEEEIYEQIKNLLKKMTAFNPADRPSLAEIINQFQEISRSLEISMGLEIQHRRE